MAVGIFPTQYSGVTHEPLYVVGPLEREVKQAPRPLWPVKHPSQLENARG